ncbi:MAG TPA: T9SS type A sorting domain-containing protein [Chitinophagaceae bacterium]|nr:T9SS type A sorting domain-containing protein [Chitinophagaceae bacterium]
MSRQIQLTIPHPCEENWDEMAPTEKGRFCASCCKQVVDFTHMSESQLAAFFRKTPRGSLCGRFSSDQLARDIEIPGKRIPWVKYFFQFALPAFLISMRATAQGNVKLVKQHTIVKPKTVLLTDSSSSKDHLMIDILANKVKLPMHAMNSPAPDLNLLTRTTPEVVGQSLTGVAGGLLIIEKPERKPNPVLLLTQKLMDTAYKFFRAFPNPASAGASLHIEWKQTEEGYYVFELIDMSGKKVYSKEIWIDSEARLLNLELPSVATGNYILQATHKNSGKHFAEKIVIE